MSYEVTIALVAESTGNGGDFDADAGRPYSARPKILLAAEETETLEKVLRRATEIFERELPGDYGPAGKAIGFYQGDPEEGFPLSIPMPTTVTITDSKGLAVWNVEPANATMRDLVLAAERKVLAGDPLRPYLLVDPKWGMAGGAPYGWDTFLEIWGKLIDVAGDGLVVWALSSRGRALLGRAVDRWKRSLAAARYTREMLEKRDADVTDVMWTLSAVRRYSLSDLMAWSGIEDPSIAADVAGWMNYELDEQTTTLYRDRDDDYDGLVTGLPIDLSVDELIGGLSRQEVVEALDDYLRSHGFLEDQEEE